MESIDEDCQEEEGIFFYIQGKDPSRVQKREVLSYKNAETLPNLKIKHQVFLMQKRGRRRQKTFPSCMRLAPVGGAKSKGSGCPDKLDAGMCGYRVAGQALSVQRRAMQLKLLL